jgi:malate dehydrogenase (oxaloacetate-decarboxylating)
VLGLGNIGVRAALPVMEGKSVIFKKFAGINAVPILVDSEDADVVISTVKAIAHSFGAIQLEDIKSPECFEIERRLSEQLDIPVFHDDQHGTAVVVLAATINALKKTRKNKNKLNIVINGAGAAGIAIAKLLMDFGIKNIVLCDHAGAVYEGRKENMNGEKELMAKVTNRKMEKGSLEHVMRKKDLFIGVSGPDLVTPAMIKSMAGKAVCFALANPVPEINPKDAMKAGAAYALDGKSLNNALAFPGIFKGALKSRARSISTKMQLAAARAIADCADENELVPNQLDPKVHSAVAKAVHEAAHKAE